jgi:hypothetical protein
MTVPVAHQAFVHAWAAKYEEGMGPEESQLLDEVGPAAAIRGYYEPDEFAAVARWKSPRSRPHILANPDSEVRDITAMAFAAPEALQHRVLTLLDGVSVATATALLAVAFPNQNTILDFRSTEALERLGEWDGSGGYLAYLEVCRGMAARLEVDLRTLDRALWQWSKDGYLTP